MPARAGVAGRPRRVSASRHSEAFAVSRTRDEGLTGAMQRARGPGAAGGWLAAASARHTEEKAMNTMLSKGPRFGPGPVLGKAPRSPLGTRDPVPKASLTRHRPPPGRAR